MRVLSLYRGAKSITCPIKMLSLGTVNPESKVRIFIRHKENMIFRFLKTSHAGPESLQRVYYPWLRRTTSGNALRDKRTHKNLTSPTFSQIMKGMFSFIYKVNPLMTCLWSH